MVSLQTARTSVTLLSSGYSTLCAKLPGQNVGSLALCVLWSEDGTRLIVYRPSDGDINPDGLVRSDGARAISTGS